MGTRRENRPVLMAAVDRRSTLATRLPGAWSAKPSARDPPSQRLGVASATNKAGGLVGHAKPPDKATPKATNGKRRCANIASPERRTRKS
jgi:hypothetical protein